MTFITNRLLQSLGYVFLGSLVLSGCRTDSENTEKDTTKSLNIPSTTLTESPSFPELLTRNQQQQPNLIQEEVFTSSPSHEAPPVITKELVLTFPEALAQAALARTMHRVRYDGRYLKIPYPMGDVPDDIGVCTDVVIRAYRELGIDLQQDVHEDMRNNFNQYPSKRHWGLRQPDTNIDHRRVYNLQTFFERQGQSLSITNDPRSYKPGDLVTWQVNHKLLHIGIVLELKSAENPDRHLIAHNIGHGPMIDDMLFDFEITGHYRYGSLESSLKIAK